MSTVAVRRHALSLLYMVSSAISMCGPSPHYSKLPTELHVELYGVPKAILNYTQHVHGFGLSDRECASWTYDTFDVVL